MFAQEKWIAVREIMLDRLSGSDRSRVLNAPLPRSTMSTQENPAAALHGLLLNILAKHTAADGGGVDYAALRADPLYVAFQHCAEGLRHFDLSTLGDRKARLAFWIEMYNTLVIHAVIALGVKRSVMERRAGFWFFRQAAYVVGGQRMSCDDIEHGILRMNRGHPFLPGPQFGASDPRRERMVEPFEPRVHFALNCASRSCPRIRAYTAGDLDAQLELATRSFLATEVSRSQDQNTLDVSSIFHWFSGDFGGREGVVRFLLENHPDEQLVTWLSGVRNGVALRYRNYDWGLNAKI
jgi:hypothetical protein